ncbi:MarC family protein [Elstera cyanobacteriorum]|uniref:MarC family protein n=1 Tax=Elstera cyanobacteriorum TaxID=2022747 RepID=UPI002354FB9C|nr:MarC family protein [Elstera cyanobacteriorum]MCK6443350.1 MarC family protein [Elstera cyanobacteriorum]
MTLSAWIADFITLFVVIDPIGVLPIYLAAIAGMNSADSRRVARLSVAISCGVLILFLVIGQALLTQLGIGFPAFRIAGGIILFLVALKMIFDGHEDVPNEERAVIVSEVAVFPVAMPGIAGPGSILAVMLMGSGNAGWLDELRVATVIAAVLGLTLIVMLFGTLLRRALGRTGILVVSRVMGLLLAALSAQSILDGLKLTFG